MAYLDPASWNVVWSDSFDGTTREDVLGPFSRAWGPGIDTSVSGQLTIHSTPDNQDSGAMVPPWGAASSGYGYGVYNFTLSMGQGVAPGPYALLWPGTDVWPGPELDLVELLPGGQPYSTVHWKGEDGTSDGWNAYDSFMLEGIDPTKVHTYTLEWKPDTLALYVDGNFMWATTENVPKSYADGGENLAPGIGMQTWWSADAQQGSGYDNSITIYDVSYWTPRDGTMPPPVPPPVPVPVPVPTPQPEPELPPSPPPATGPAVWSFTDPADAPAWAPLALDWRAGDKLDLSGMSVAGGHALHFAGLETDATDKAFGIWQWNDGSSVIRVDLDGDSRADLSFDLPDGVVLTAADVVLGAAPPEPEPEPETPAPDPDPTPDPGPDLPGLPELPGFPGLPAPVPDIEGGDAADTISVRLQGVSVSGGGGADTILLRHGHEDVVVILNAGEAAGDEVLGFAGAGRIGGDVLLLHGYGAGASLEAQGGDAWAVMKADGTKADTFYMPGVDNLTADDYLFA